MINQSVFFVFFIINPFEKVIILYRLNGVNLILVDVGAVMDLNICFVGIKTIHWGQHTIGERGGQFWMMV